MTDPLGRYGAAAGLWLCAVLMVASCGGKDDGEGPAAPEMGDGLSAEFSLPERALGSVRLESVPVEPRELVIRRSYPGIVHYKDTARAHLVTQVGGVVQDLTVQLGSVVAASEAVGAIASRELGEAESRYIEALHAERFADTVREAETGLWEKSITSREKYLAAVQAWEAARLRTQSAAHALGALGVTEQGLKSLGQRSIAGAEASAEMAPVGRLTLRAPVAGEVVAMFVTAGEAVEPGMALMEVADLGAIWVDTRVPATDLEHLEPGSRATVSSGSGAATSTSEVVYVAPEVDSASQTALVRIELSNPDGAWRPGLYVTVEADLAVHAAPLTVPVGALVADPDNPEERLVFVQHRPGKYQAIPVTVTHSDSEYAAVEGDLRPGDRVMVGETIFLKAVWMGEGGMEE